jgi:hypothetical protein
LGRRGEAEAGVQQLAGATGEARTLLALVRDRCFPRPGAMKIGIEGMELPVLRHYFAAAERRAGRA